MKNNYMAQLNKVRCPNELLSTPVDTLKELFAETDKQKITSDLASVRGWIMEALENQMTEQEFESWMDAQ